MVSGGWQVPRSDLQGGTLPCDLSHDVCYVPIPPCGQADTCENITFLQLRLRAIINCAEFGRENAVADLTEQCI